jgi:hypothetical protein
MTTPFQIADRATVQVPSGIPGETPRFLAAQYRGVENRKLQLTVLERLKNGTAVSVEHEDTLFLGEVISCTQDVEDRWHLQVEVEQVLTGLQSLMNLRAALLGEPSRAGAFGLQPATAGRF